MLTKCLTVALIPNLKCLNSRYLNFFDRAKYDASNEAEAETLDAALGVHLQAQKLSEVQQTQIMLLTHRERMSNCQHDNTNVSRCVPITLHHFRKRCIFDLTHNYSHFEQLRTVKTSHISLCILRSLSESITLAGVPDLAHLIFVAHCKVKACSNVQFIRIIKSLHEF